MDFFFFLKAIDTFITSVSKNNYIVVVNIVNFYSSKKVSGFPNIDNNINVFFFDNHITMILKEYVTLKTGVMAE